MRGRVPRWRWVAAVCGALLAVAAIAIALLWTAIFDYVLSSQVALSPGSRSYHEWLAPTVPLYFKVFFFNWTNADSFPEEIPHFEQLGPYSFRERRRHVNVTWHPHNSSVGYRTFKSWHFDPDTSNGSLDDVVTTLNVIAASAVYRAREWSSFRQRQVSLGLTLYGQHLFITKHVGELLFEGYEDALLDLAKGLPSTTTGGAPPVDRFAFFYERNNSIDTDGYMEVSTGVATGSIPGQVLRWNYNDHLPFYEGQCSQVLGTAGEFLQRNLTEKSRLAMFVPDLCRTVLMDYEESGEKFGLHYNKYAFSMNTFDNSPSNQCFCNGECSWGGVMNVSACRFGSPAFLSLPHFLHADPDLLTLVKGLQPDPTLHSFYFAVEPKLGVPLEVAARFQFNIFIESNPGISLYEKVPKMMFPIFWVEELVAMDEKIAAELSTVRLILDWGTVVCACAALVFAIFVAVVTYCNRKTDSTYKNDFGVKDKPKDEAEMKLNPM